MPVVPNLVERLAIRFGLVPPFLVDVVSAAALRALGVAFELGVLDALRGGPLTAGELAERCGADAGTLRALLDLLTRAGYLSRRGEHFSLSGAARRWLVGPRALPHFARYWHDLLFDHFDELGSWVRSRERAPRLHDWLSRSGRWDVFNAAMAELAGPISGAIARAAALPPDARTIADLGGSHALNAAAFCRAYPGLHATVIDLPEALVSSKDRVRELRLGDRITLRAGELLRDDLGGPYDAALLSQLVHYLAPESVAILFARVRDVLGHGGRILIFDQIRGTAPLPLAAAFFSLLALAYRVSLGGGLYSYEELARWLRDAGFSQVERRSVRAAPGHALIVATRV